jgi:hypothetical protein
MGHFEFGFAIAEYQFLEIDSNTFITNYVRVGVEQNIEIAM